MRNEQHEKPLLPHRFLGLELSGAKNPKTAIAVLEYYPKEQKIFLLDIYDRIIGRDGQTGDEALLELLEELKPGVAKMGVNVPLELPPALPSSKKNCEMPSKSREPAVKWMRETARKAARESGSHQAREFTPYTQRPVELWVRYHILPRLPKEARFEIDEAMGGNKAPLTCRMNFLKCHLPPFDLIEVWPKLTVSLLAQSLGLSRRVVATYRKLEEGAHARSKILEALAESEGIFIYERDLRKLSGSITAFDAFVCAYTALLAETGKVASPPHGFPLHSGWLGYPKTELR